MTNVILNKAMARFKNIDKLVDNSTEEDDITANQQLDDELKVIMEQNENDILSSLDDDHSNQFTTDIPSYHSDTETPIAIFEYLQKQENVSHVNEIMLFSKDNVRIYPDQTFKSQKLSGSIFATHEIVREDHGINVIIQSSDRKSKCSYMIKSNVPIRSILERYAIEKHNKQMNSVKFSFDGIRLTGDETVQDLGLESGEVIDMQQVCNKIAISKVDNVSTKDFHIVID
ncbi:hypothetical protein GJ496_004847 [Pomphorhynchus laevis]|nr:hypothetical protein GJ496_004847 [Pomphorhynchus laevis]